MDRRGLGRVAAVAANTYRESVRERVLYNLVLFAVLMTLSGLLLSQLSIRQDEKIVKDLGLASMEIFGGLIAIFIGVGLVSKEIDRRSLYPLLAKPLTRTEFLLGKFAGLSFTLLVNVAIMTAGLYATVAAMGRGFDPRLIKAIYPILLGLLVVTAVALLFSTMTSPALAAIATFCVVLAGRSSDLIRNMKEVVPEAPGWLTTTLYYLLPNLRDFDFKNAVVYGDAVSWSALLGVTLYAVLYVGALLTLALLRFRSRDLS